MFEKTKKSVESFEQEVRSHQQNPLIRTLQRVLIVIGSILVIGDVYLVFSPYDTISAVMARNSSSQYFVITWLWGVLAAHLFLARKSDKIYLPESIGFLMILIVSFLIYLFGNYIDELDGYMQIVLFSAGVVVGHFLWPQRL